MPGWSGLIEQGWTTSVRETLTAKHREIGAMPPVRPPPPPDPDAPVVVVEKIETPGTINFDLPPQRNYVITGLSDSRGRRDLRGTVPVALLDPLTPPEKIEITWTEHAMSLRWPGQPEDIPMTVPVGSTQRCSVCRRRSAALLQPHLLHPLHLSHRSHRAAARS